MDVTGCDSVILVCGAAGPVVERFLAAVHDAWPQMLVCIEPDSATPGVAAERIEEGGEFSAWCRGLGLPPHQGEVLVARDVAMVAAWDEQGYALTDGQEGPFMVMYQISPRRQLRLMVHEDEDPYRDGDEGSIEAYDVVLADPTISLVTLVTPDLESAFVQRLIDLFLAAATASVASEDA